MASLGLYAQEKKKDTTKKKATKELPLEPGRTVKFTTNEGTWISLDVSPDGKTIVFDLMGDLYTMPMSGGKATQLTSGMAYDVHPRYSPDGKSILFISDKSGNDNIWTLDVATKKDKQLTKDKKGNYFSAEISHRSGDFQRPCCRFQSTDSRQYRGVRCTMGVDRRSRPQPVCP